MARKSKKGATNRNTNPGIGRNRYTVAQKKRELAADLEGVTYIAPSERYLDDEDVIDDYVKPVAPSYPRPVRDNQLRGSEFYFRESAPALPVQTKTGQRPRVSHWAETSVVDDGRGPVTPPLSAKIDATVDNLRDKLCKKKPKRKPRGKGAGRKFVPWC